jgi:hypothetical protein
MNRLSRILSRRKPTVPADEWERVKTDAEAADEILNSPRFQFFRDYLSNVKASVTDCFVTNKIRPVQEHIRISDVLTKTLSTSKAEQENELSGKYKLVEEIMADLARVASLPDEYRQAQQEGKVEIESDEEKNG